MSGYDHKNKESKWAQYWKDKGFFDNKADSILDTDKPLKYILNAFAYPSGAGLHCGHALGYTATDVLARFYTAKGYHVINPIGWDSFGLPAENFAIKHGVHPRVSTEKNITTFTGQLSGMGLSVDWKNELATHTPEYYKWTQWIFQLLYKKGLAYKKEALVNWDPVDQTVLANEQVLPDGTAERSGAKVEQKMMSQWFFKITEYAQRLLDDLETVDWPESTKAMQRNWIGRSEGAEVDFSIEGSDAKITVFTTRIDTLFSGTFLLLSPEHPLVDMLTTTEQVKEIEEYKQFAASKSQLERTDLNKDKTAAFTGSFAINPANGERMPIWIADFVLANYGSGAVFADAHDERDFELAKKYGITLNTSITPEDETLIDEVKNLQTCYSGYGILYNSDQFDGMHSNDAKKAISEWGEDLGWARAKVTYRLRDWLVSRQRYWGSPIPVAYVDGQEKLIPQESLPVLLPEHAEFKPTGQSPLIGNTEFHSQARACFGEGADMEVDTMDTFMCSSWYFWRFLDAHNTTEFADINRLKKIGPVDNYVVGAEHTVLHLLYSRFFTKVLYDEGLIDYTEPFQKMNHPGLVLGSDGRKMGKRYGNGVDPLDMINEYGGDSLRMYVLFIGPFDQPKIWNDSALKGVRRFIDKVYSIGNSAQEHAHENTPIIESALQTLIDGIAHDIESYSFNTCVSKYMIFTNLVKDNGGVITYDQLKRFLIVLSIFAPFISEELYQSLPNHLESVYLEIYPTFDASKIMTQSTTVSIVINGKLRGSLEVSEGMSEEDIYSEAQNACAKWFEGKEIKFKKYIPSRTVTYAVG